MKKAPRVAGLFCFSVFVIYFPSFGVLKKVLGSNLNV